MAAEHAVGVVRGVCVLASWPQTEVLRSCLLWARNLLQYGLLLSIDRRSPVAHQYDTVYDYVKGAVIHDDDPEDIRLFFWLERLDIVDIAHRGDPQTDGRERDLFGQEKVATVRRQNRATLRHTSGQLSQNVPADCYLRLHQLY